MADENGTTETKKRPRKPPQRRGYKGELDTLQAEYDAVGAAVAQAVKLLRKAKETMSDGKAASAATLLLVEVAIETLSGE